MSARREETIRRAARRGVMALEIMLSNREVFRLLHPRALAGDREAAALIVRIVEQMRGMGLSGPPLIAMLTEEV
ncbi:hypothetical protein AB0H20_12585 [Nocardia fluminea]|uniref:hypothetical protein n=1 Tax=Nocardia fluminea TaxID=134984 RepID=UPI0033EFC1AF